MANDLAIQNSMLPGLVPGADAAQIVAMIHVHNEGRGLELSRFPNEREMTILKTRTDELNFQLKPISYADAMRQKAVAAFSDMFRGYPALANTDTRALLNDFLTHLKEYPLFAIVAACEDVKHGRVKDIRIDRVPNTVQLRRVVEGYVADVREEKFHIDQRLTIKKILTPVMPAEQRKKFGQALADLAESMRAPLEREKQEARDRFVAVSLDRREKDILRDYAAAGIDPIRARDGSLMSYSLAKQIGLLQRTKKKRGENPEDDSDLAQTG